MKYVLSSEAGQDLEDILEYFLNRSIDAGEKFIREFNKKCQYIAQFPYIGRSYANFEASLRGVPIDGYIIFYQVFEDSIVIARVVSGSRNLKLLFLQSDE